MTTLPVISGKDAIKVFLKAGWLIKSRKGSHVKLVKLGHPNPITVPVHGSKPLDRGTLHSIIRSSDLAVNDFIDLM